MRDEFTIRGLLVATIVLAAFISPAYAQEDEESPTYTMPGLPSEDSLDAQEGPVELVTTDAAGNLASDGGAIASAIVDNESALSEVLADVMVNTADVAANRTDIDSNTETILANIASIGQNMSDITANAGGVTTNVTDITENRTDIDVNTLGIADNSSAMDLLRADLRRADRRIDRNRGETLDNRDGVTMAMALVGTADLNPGEQRSLAINWATFNGAHAFAIGTTARLGEQFSVNGGVAYGTNSNKVSARAGVRWGF